jgi:hypothetical protein
MDEGYSAVGRRWPTGRCLSRRGLAGEVESSRCEPPCGAPASYRPVRWTKYVLCMRWMTLHPASGIGPSLVTACEQPMVVCQFSTSPSVAQSEADLSLASSHPGSVLDLSIVPVIIRNPLPGMR